VFARRDRDDAVQVIRHEGEHVNGDLGAEDAGVDPFAFDEETERIDAHRTVDDVAEEAGASEGAEGDEVGSTGGVVMVPPAHGLAVEAFNVERHGFVIMSMALRDGWGAAGGGMGGPPSAPTTIIP
jgi:hypothetical protein